ncbi:YafY family protein [Magnetospirillum sp. 64-120]|uniref:helix-turn-helix transcriptional regulator n=1 Tax=Magnetospirillum sp. 64-120 TaxID=1895778 RepID=UPI000926AE6A|nr:YafY family protein [Magnetospirillum sp. 64-120]OJX70478.1 MAG: DNA-binding transcriptional regulator [Magnetospirillum sp. 64-120]
MRRAERLFQIVQALRGGRLTTARQLAEKLEVSERTIYRDVAHLAASGVPVDGAAGAGYILRDGFDIPPLMFDSGEIEALVLGVRLARAWAGTRMAQAAGRALDKIEAVIPDHLRPRIEASRLFAPDFRSPPQVRHDLDRVNEAIENRHTLRFDYVREDGEASTREVRPLGLFFWGPVWTLVAWCQLRHDFRSFRLDRMREPRSTGTCFPETAGQTLADYLTRVRAECRQDPPKTA